MKPFYKFHELIIFEDDDVIVVNKPPMISTLYDRVNTEINMLRLGKKYCPQIQACHRLDKETSGCLLFAKNPMVYKEISLQFENRIIKKVYHAIIEGMHSFENLSVDLPILNIGKEKVLIDNKGKHALTIFNTLKIFKHYTMLQCEPVTGRLHQIRIHLSSLGAVIAGDQIYGGKLPYLSAFKRKYKSKEFEEERPIMSRFALHAHSISFNDINNESKLVKSTYPKDFDTFRNLLEKHDLN